MRRSKTIALACVLLLALLTLSFYFTNRDRLGHDGAVSGLASATRVDVPRSEVPVTSSGASTLSPPTEEGNWRATAVAEELPVPEKAVPYAEGRVVDEEDMPVHSARVSSRDDPSVFTTTDANGSFSLPGLSGWGKRSLLITADHMVPSVEPCILGRKAVLKTKRGVLFQGNILTVSPSDARTALAGQLFTLRDINRTPSYVGTYTTDNSGRFELWPADGSSVQIAVPLKGRATWSEIIPIKGPYAYDVVIPADDAAIVISVVNAVSGAALAGAQITCDSHAVGKTDSQGVFTLPALAGRLYELRADYTGMCGQVMGVRIPAGAAKEVAQFSVVPEGVLYGKVIDADAKPVAGASVRLMVARGSGPVSMPGVSGSQTGAIRATDVNGEFRFGEIGSSRGDTTVTIEVSSPLYSVYQSEYFKIANGAVLGPIECVLVRGSTIVGVVMSGGDGVRATITIPSKQASLLTDSRGRFEWTNLAPGEITLCATLDRHRGVRQSITLNALAGEETELLIELDYALEHVSGIVSAQSGAAIANVRVDVKSETLDEERPAIYTTRTDAGGRYRVEVPVQVAAEGDRTYDVKVVRWNEDCAQDNVQPPAVIDFVCATSSFVRFTAVDASTGVQIPLDRLDMVWKRSDGVATLCLDRSEEDGAILLAVPAENGQLIVQYGELVHRVDLVLESDEVRELGVVEVGASTAGR